MASVRIRGAFVAVWFAGVALASAGLWKYELTAGPSARAVGTWPAGSSLPRPEGLPALVMFAHPRCPCTRASVGQLRSVMSRFAGRVACVVAFFKPSDSGDDWLRTASFGDASSIPGVRTAADPDGREAERFHAETSGHVMLYGADGTLLFTGGITAGRGHVGDNAQSDDLVSALERAAGGPGAGGAAVSAGSGAASAPPASCGPVFGCPLKEARR